MTTIPVKIPDSLYKSLFDLARHQGVSVDQFICAAIGEKLSALMSEDYLKERGKKGDRIKYESILAKVPDVDPEPYDKI